MKSMSTHPITDLERDLDWLAVVLATRLKLHLRQECRYTDIAQVPVPKLGTDSSSYAEFVQRFGLDVTERLALLLALAPQVRPRLLDIFFVKNSETDRRFTEFGGVVPVNGNGHNGALPTGETLSFVLGGERHAARIQAYQLLDRDHIFARQHILRLDTPDRNQPFLSGLLQVTDEVKDYLILGKERKPDFSEQFPAKYLTTKLEWSDLVLEPHTLQQLDEIRIWNEHKATLNEQWGLKRKLRPGYRTLFFGPPGTGKTMTACLLGKTSGKDVYKVDLSAVVSKFIGETEKNLGKVFDQAHNKDWILFFDEADALFGKRTQVQDAHDRYANQEIAYLLQRIEDYSGLIILASNRKGDIDEAFGRRFESMVHFPLPRAEQRLTLWQKGFSPVSQLEDKVDLGELARRYEISGAMIMNVIRYCSLLAINRHSTVITQDDVIAGLKREYLKEGRTI